MNEFIDDGDVGVDWAVVKAIGLQLRDRRIINADPPIHGVLISSREWDEMRGIEHPTCEGDVACIPFQPSVDLNAAFAAAEKVRLFYDRVYVLNQDGCLLWGIEQQYFPPGDGSDLPRTIVSRQPTPALAICTAILELRETSNG